MFRVNVFAAAPFVGSAVALVVMTAMAASALAGEAYTTRIEPRGFYGATISIEEGVRVFRPLPPVRHVIVNPEGRTPLSLSYTDVRVHEQRSYYDASGGQRPGATYYGGGLGIGGGFYGNKFGGGQSYGKGRYGHHSGGAGGQPAGGFKGGRGHH